MKIRRLFLVNSILCFSLLFTGCGEPLYTMTPEEEAIITLYASKTVSKFNKNQLIGIANARVKPGELEEIVQEEEEVVETEEENPEVELDPETGEPIAPSDTAEQEPLEEKAAEESGADAGYSFTEAISIPGIEFSCSEFEVTPEYKTNNFVLSKVNGKQYLVLHVNATNTATSSVDFSQYNKDRKYTLSLNNGAEESTVFTPLSNDLAMYNGVLKAGDTKNFILVFLFSNSSVEDISSLKLFVNSDGTTRGTTI